MIVLDKSPSVVCEKQRRWAWMLPDENMYIGCGYECRAGATSGYIGARKSPVSYPRCHNNPCNSFKGASLVFWADRRVMWSTRTGALDVQPGVWSSNADLRGAKAGDVHSIER